jgi:hypothetical protein
LGWRRLYWAFGFNRWRFSRRLDCCVFEWLGVRRQCRRALAIGWRSGAI